VCVCARVCVSRTEGHISNQPSPDAKNHEHFFRQKLPHEKGKRRRFKVTRREKMPTTATVVTSFTAHFEKANLSVSARLAMRAFPFLHMWKESIRKVGLFQLTSAENEGKIAPIQ